MADEKEKKRLLEEALEKENQTFRRQRSKSIRRKSLLMGVPLKRQGGSGIYIRAKSSNSMKKTVLNGLGLNNKQSSLKKILPR